MVVFFVLGKSRGKPKELFGNDDLTQQLDKRREVIAARLIDDLDEVISRRENLAREYNSGPSQRWLSANAPDHSTGFGVVEEMEALRRQHLYHGGLGAVYEFEIFRGQKVPWPGASDAKVEYRKSQAVAQQPWGTGSQQNDQRFGPSR